MEVYPYRFVLSWLIIRGVIMGIEGFLNLLALYLYSL